MTTCITIDAMCSLVSNTFELPVFFISPKGKVIYDNLRGQPINPLIERRTGSYLNPLYFEPRRTYRIPVITKSVFSEKFILISYFDGDLFEGTLIMGPTLSHPIPNEVLTGIINDRDAFFYRDQVARYYERLPILSNDKLNHISVFIYHLFNKELLSPQSVLYEDFQFDNYEKAKGFVNLEFTQYLQSADHNQVRLFEKKLLFMIKEGRVEDIDELSFIKEEESSSVLSKSSFLRSNKNHIITLIALVTRASMDGGLNEDTAFALHDRFIQRLEELDRLDEIRSLAREVLHTFAEKVKQARHERYSKKIIACKEYIHKHIYEEIHHNDIALEIGLSPKYLSALFKKEVGISVSEYIQQTKIEEIKRLLAYSAISISELGSLFHFNDQSYLTKVFKKIVGVTPKQYREKHHLIEKG